MATLTATQQLTLTINPTDKKGNPAPVENIHWATSDETVATLVVAEDGLSALVVAGAPGSGRVTVNVDALIGEGEAPLIGEEPIDVTPGQASVLAITVGAAEEQP